MKSHVKLVIDMWKVKCEMNHMWNVKWNRITCEIRNSLVTFVFHTWKLKCDMWKGRSWNQISSKIRILYEEIPYCGSKSHVQFECFILLYCFWSRTSILPRNMIEPAIMTHVIFNIIYTILILYIYIQKTTLHLLKTICNIKDLFMQMNYIHFILEWCKLFNHDLWG
jgi:hypothetical protein